MRRRRPRSRPKPEATALVDDLARRLAAAGHEPDRGRRAVRGGPPAVPRRAGRARPPAGARGRSARALYEDASALLDRLLLRLIATYQEGGPACRSGCSPALTSTLSPSSSRSRCSTSGASGAAASSSIWAIGMLLLRHRRRLRGDRRGGRLERGAVPDLVPDRRGLDRRLAGAGDGLPARPDALRLQLRGLPVPRRPVHVPGPQQARVRGRRARCRCCTSSPPAMLALAVAVETYFRTTAGRGSRPRRSSARPS